MKTIRETTNWLARWVPMALIALAAAAFLGGCARDANAMGGSTSAGGDSSGSDDSDPEPTDPPPEDPPPAPDPDPEPEPPGPLSLEIHWSSSTENADGSTCTDLAGYRVYRGTTSGRYTVMNEVGRVTSFETSPLDSGTYYFVVSAVDDSGNESDFSDETSATID